jgi:hypothetical protein
MSQTKTPFGPVGQTPPRGFTTMEVNGLRCEINMPPATKSRFDGRGEELTQGLARYAKTDVYRVDDFPNCPEHWQRSDSSRGIVSCFMLAKADHMVWIDLTMNGSHTHHVAALFSAQGVNAVTGQKVEPPVRLEQYDRNTPPKGWKGGKDWPEQNYIATTCSGPLWRDGFRAKDGKTREFVFTEDMARDVATAVIGAEERVEAFGVALFLSKEPRPRPVYRSRGALESTGDAPQFLGATRSAKSLGVGAGAVVNQTVTRDPNRLDFWQDEPSALFIVYYVGAEEFQRITGSAPGRSGGDEGFLGGTPVGNP